MKINPLKDNPPLDNKKFFLASMVSPEGRNKHDVYGFKFHDVAPTYKDAKNLVKRYHGMDPDFDVFIGTIGKWCPWVFNPDEIADQEYADSKLNELISEHRKHVASSNDQYHRDVQDHVQKIKQNSTKEGQENAMKEKEHVVAVMFKIKQLKLHLKRRQEELQALEDIFHTKYTKEERNLAKKAKMPLVEPSPMQYSMMSPQQDENEGQEVTEPSTSASSVQSDADKICERLKSSN